MVTLFDMVTQNWEASVSWQAQAEARKNSEPATVSLILMPGLEGWCCLVSFRGEGFLAYF